MEVEITDKFIRFLAPIVKAAMAKDKTFSFGFWPLWLITGRQFFKISFIANLH